MHLGNSKYIFVFSVIGSRSQTHSKSNTHTIIAFFECVWVLRSTSKVSNAFEVKYTHTQSWLTWSWCGPETTTLTCNKSLNVFRCFKVLRRFQTHSKLNTHTQSWLNSKNITTYIHRYLLAVTLLMLSLWETLVYNSPFISR